MKPTIETDEYGNIDIRHAGQRVTIGRNANRDNPGWIVDAFGVHVLIPDDPDFDPTWEGETNA